MNMNQIINMVLRRVMSIAINKGINAGVDKFSSRTAGDATPRDKMQNAQTKQRLRQTARVTRRLGKF